MTSHEAFKFEALEILKPGTSTVLPDYSFPLVVIVVGSFLHCLENFTDVNMYLNSTHHLKLLTIYVLLLLIQSYSSFTMQCITHPSGD